MDKKNTQTISIDEFFKNNNILKKFDKNSLKKHEIYKMSDKEYYEKYYTKGFDEILLSIDYEGYKKMFKKIADQIGSNKDVVELGCGSGILGTYIAIQNNFYKGIETNVHAIKKAKERAKQQNLNPDIFMINDYLSYNNQHEILLTCKFLGGIYYQIDKERIKKASQISDEIIGIEQIKFNDSDKKILIYNNVFKNLGYKFELLHEPILSKGTDAKYFLFHAKK